MPFLGSSIASICLAVGDDEQLRRNLGVALAGIEVVGDGSGRFLIPFHRATAGTFAGSWDGRIGKLGIDDATGNCDCAAFGRWDFA